MSTPKDGANPPSYETIMTNSESTPPMSTIPGNESPLPPAYSPPYPTEAWNFNSVTPPWNLDNMTTQNTDSPYYKTFLKGKPKALGIVMIIAAIVEIILGIALAIIAFTNTVDSGIPFWGPVFYIIAGSLTLVCYKKPSIIKIKLSVTVCCISCFVSVIALILNVIDLALVRCFSVPIPNNFSDNISNNDTNNNNGNNEYEDYSEDVNHHSHSHGNINTHHERSSYETQCPQKMAGVYAVLSLLLITNLLMFFVTLISSAFGCRSFSETQSTAPQVYVIPNDPIKKPDDFPELPIIPAQPPPYTANEIKAIPQY